MYTMPLQIKAEIECIIEWPLLCYVYIYIYIYIYIYVYIYIHIYILLFALCCTTYQSPTSPCLLFLVTLCDIALRFICYHLSLISVFECFGVVTQFLRLISHHCAMNESITSSLCWMQTDSREAIIDIFVLMCCGPVTLYGAGPGSKVILAQVLVWCRPAPSHHINQCWHLIREGL